MLISDLSSDVCSSDLLPSNVALKIHALLCRGFLKGRDWFDFSWYVAKAVTLNLALLRNALIQAGPWAGDNHIAVDMPWLRSEEHTSELQSLMRISYAVFCLKTKNIITKRLHAKHNIKS